MRQSRCWYYGTRGECRARIRCCSRERRWCMSGMRAGSLSRMHSCSQHVQRQSGTKLVSRLCALDVPRALTPPGWMVVGVMVMVPTRLASEQKARESTEAAEAEAARGRRIAGRVNFIKKERWIWRGRVNKVRVSMRSKDGKRRRVYIPQPVNKDIFTMSSCHFCSGLGARGCCAENQHAYGAEWLMQRNLHDTLQAGGFRRHSCYVVHSWWPDHSQNMCLILRLALLHLPQNGNGVWPEGSEVAYQCLPSNLQTRIT